MAEFRMPSLGSDMQSGVLVEWLKHPGDRLKRGDLIAVIETDKGAIEIEAFQDGVIDTLVAHEGERKNVGDVLAILDVEGEAPAVAISAESVPAASSAPAAQASTPATTRRRVSPAARKRAEELGVEIELVEGTGRDGAVTSEDVERAAAARAARGQETRRAGPDVAAMRRAIASAMTRANREIPHYYVSTTVDIEPVLDWLERHNAGLPPGERILPTVPIIRAAALALRQVPELNGFYGESGFEAARSVNVGVAIALRGGGLVAPAIFDSETHPLPQLMDRLRDLTGRVRAGRMRQQELTGATFTVTSLGEGGVEMMVPIISPPQVGILGVGSIVERPWASQGWISARHVVTLTLAGDHRASDGRSGARVLELISRSLERPETL